MPTLNLPATPNCDFTSIEYFSLYYGNIQSVPAKPDIRSKISSSVYKVFCLTETWLHKDDVSDRYFPNDFQVYRMDRRSRGGGVAILVKDEFKSTEVENVCDPDCESVCVKVKLQPVPLVLYLAYVNQPQQIVLLKHFNAIQRLLSRESESRIIVLGDFNLHDVEWQLDESEMYFLPHNLTSHSNSTYFQAASEFLESVQQLPMFQLSNVINIASNVLDLVFANNYQDLQVYQAPVSITKVTGIVRYHPPLEILYEHHTAIEPASDEMIEIYLYTKGNYERMMQQLDAVNFAELFDRTDTEAAFDYFYAFMDRLIYENIPRISVKKNSNKPRWWTRKLQKLKNRRDKMFKRKKKENGITDEYVKALEEFNVLHDKLHNDYIAKVQSKICSNPSEFWAYAKSKRKQSKYPLEMKYKDQRSETPQEIVEMFANYFEDIYERYDNDETTFDDVYENEPLDPKEIFLTMFDIERAIMQLKAKNSCGPDEMSPIVVKKCMDAMIWPLWILFQKTYDHGIISSKLKISRVAPVFKKNKKTEVANYRIVAISPVILKVFEIAILAKLLNVINPLLSNCQHGFRPNRSVTTNLMNLSVAAHEAFTNKCQLDTFYGDFKNAFDKVDIIILMTKLWKFGVGKQTAKWIYEFLAGRTFYVQIGNLKSRIYVSSSGVPAGSILGPTLFLAFIDDIADVPKNSIPLLFADDVKLACHVRSISDVRGFQDDITRLTDWCTANKLHLNLQKCFVISIRRIRNFINATYTIGDHAIERRTEVRDIGVLVDEKLTFSSHIEQKTGEARQSFGYIKRISNGQFGTRTLKILYTSYVRSKLEFGSVIWDPFQEVYRDDIESIQKQFLMYALGDSNKVPPYRLLPYEERCAKFGMDTLVFRRKIINSMFAYDLYHNRFNDTSLFNRLVRAGGMRTLRTNRLLYEEAYHRDYSYHQPFAKMIRLINQSSEFLNLTRERFRRSSEIRFMKELHEVSFDVF